MKPKSRYCSDYDLKVLRFYAGYPDTGIVSGAALNQATEFLIKSNYITAKNHALTPKATALLNGVSVTESIADNLSEIEKPSNLHEWQILVGRWALKTFGPTPPAVHAARMSREMADVMDCIAIGDMDNLGRALAGVMVVGLALADSQNINLETSLGDEHAENQASHWVRDGWGQWVRHGANDIKNTEQAQIICEMVQARNLSPKAAARLLHSDGVDLITAIKFLIKNAQCHSDDFQSQAVQDLTPRARGANNPWPKFYPLKHSTTVTGMAEMIDTIFETPSRLTPAIPTAMLAAHSQFLKEDNDV